MLEKILKKSSWTDIVVSLIFILFGAMLIINPDSIISIMAIVLGIIFILLGVFKIVNFYASGKADNYLLAIGIVAIIAGIVVMFCGDIIMSVFRILMGIWIIYSGIMNIQSALIWKDDKSKLWIITLILSILVICAGIYVLVNSGAILRTIGIVIVVYAIINIIENVIFINKMDN